MARKIKDLEAWFLIDGNKGNIPVFGYCERTRKQLMECLGFKGFTKKFIKASNCSLQKCLITNVKKRFDKRGKNK